MQLAPRALLRAWFQTALLMLVSAGSALAQSSVDLTTTAFYEKGGPLNMTVVNPAAKATADIAQTVSIRAGWQADVVSGASVAIVDGPSGSGVDAVTAATVRDFRQVVSGGLGLRSEIARVDANYSYGWENDYRSHGFSLSAATDLFDRNTTLELSYARGWDSVCDLFQPQAEKAVERRRMPTSNGCFAKDRGRSERPLDVHTLQGAWTQAWTPIFNTQLVLSAQLMDGYQGNPYREVWLGRAAVQEHHPSDRARYAAALSARVWIRPIGGALQAQLRAYRDTWDVQSLSAELAYERGFGQYLRLRVRGRYHTQGKAAFFSDDYALAPRGQYFSGDRELSQLDTWLAGLTLAVSPPADAQGKVLRVLESFRFVLKGDYLHYTFKDFHYGTASVPYKSALFGTLGFDATF